MALGKEDGKEEREKTVGKEERMEKELNEASWKESEKDDDGSDPEARDQGERKSSDAADIVTTGLGEMSLSGSKKEEQDKNVIASQDFNLSSGEERNKSSSLNEPVISGKRSEESSSILPPHYSPPSNLMSSRTMTGSGLQKEKDDDGELDRKDQECSFHSGTLPSWEQKVSDKSDDGKEKNIGQDLEPSGQSFETVDRSSDTNLNDLEQEGKLRMKQRVSIVSSDWK